MEARPQDIFLIIMPFFVAVLLGKPYIHFLQRRYLGQYIREDGPQHHHSKAGTPTAGGVLILISVVIGWLFSCFGPNRAYMLSLDVMITLAITLILGALGFIDDYLKIAKKNNKGISGYAKLAVQAGLGFGLGWYMMKTHEHTPIFFWNLGVLDLGQYHLQWLYPVFTAFVLTATSNAVNLTDGLDGLAAGTSVVTLLAMAIIFFASFEIDIAAVYPDLGSFTYLLIGATLGFFIHNVYPARLFMGDTGSLALGGAIGTLAILSQSEFWILLFGGIFVAEALSVVLQVASFKSTGKRIFRMSPLHHHFELGGLHETSVVLRFMLVQIALSLTAVFLYNGKAINWLSHITYRLGQMMGHG